MFGYPWFKTKLDLPPGIVPIDVSGSLQNPAWSPDGRQLVFTRFRNGYNKGPADIYTYDFASKLLYFLVGGGYDNVTAPGSTWNGETGHIVFSSDRSGPDSVYLIRVDDPKRDAWPVTNFPAIEPSMSPDGTRFVCETPDHRIMQCAVRDADRDRLLTMVGDNCRQPNWSPTGDHIVYQQKFVNWELMLHDVRTITQRCLTRWLPGDKTDATFTPDGKRIVYSGSRPGQRDGLCSIPIVSVTPEDGYPEYVECGPGYFGAASVSPNGKWIAAETDALDPEDGPGTKIIVLPFH